MGGCPGQRKVDGPGGRLPQLQASLGPSMSQEHGPLLRRAAVTRGMRGPRRDTRQGFHQTPPREVGVYGEFYGTEGDELEAGEMF
jgi:hypothetical protein